MNDPFPQGGPPRYWRQDERALAGGVCAGLAQDLDLPLPLVRAVAALFLILPTGLAYLALTLLLRRRPAARRTRWSEFGAPASSRTGSAVPGRPEPVGQSWVLLRHRFETLEPRLKNIEAFVTSSDFDLHRGFRRMGD